MKYAEITPVLESKGYRKNGMTFLTPAEILQPVINTFGGTYSGFGSHEVEIEDNGTILVAYGRAGIVHTVNIDDEMTYQIGFMYSVEVGKPFIKVFSGVNVKICSNMCIFGSNDIRTFVIATSGFAAAYDAVTEFFNAQSEKIEQAKRTIAALKAIQFNSENINGFIGHLCRAFSDVRNVAGTNCIMNACRLINDPQSRYYLRDGERLNGWQVYNALTEYYGDKTHVLDHPEKVYAIYKEMREYCGVQNLDNVIEVVTPYLIEEGVNGY